MARSPLCRTPLLLGGAALAMATVLALPAPAGADAFNASPVFVRGSGNVDRSVANTDTITITSSTAVLDWTPFEDNSGNALTFLPNGNTAYFQDAPGQGGFALLNRILPSTNGNIVVFEGSVISRLQDASGGFSSGGTVAFYSPTGILVGSTAVFDVGQLLLTTLDPDLDSFESYVAGGTLRLAGPSGSTAAVDIAAGAQFSASAEGSYLAVAAPQIIMRGTAYINGSTAYAAGEQVNLTYNNGLFDIQIPVGTSVGTPIDHSGTTGGPSSMGSGDNHMIYAVAKAQTDPISMLLRGNLGFDAATTAGIDNGDIILSAGYDVFGRNVFTGPVASAATAESISILGGSNLSSSVFAGATGGFNADTGAGTIGFADDLTIRAARSISLTARNGNDLTVAGNSSFQAKGTIAPSGDVTGGEITLTGRDAATLAFAGNLSAFATPDQRDGTSTGGTIALIADGGTVSVGGDVDLFAQANNHFPSGTLGDGFGGTTRLLAQNDGLIDLRGGLQMNTNAFGNGLAGRTATAGTSEILARSGGRIDVAGDALMQASGFGGDADGSLGVIDGGAGIGGLVQVRADGGSIAFGGTVSMQAEGYGGDGASFFGAGPGDGGGIGRGGLVLINSIDGSITIADTTTLLASGRGGRGGSGGAGFGGRAQVLANGTGRVNLVDLSASAHGLGGDGSAEDGRGGDGEGGQSVIFTEGAGDIRLSGSANLQANSFGGDGHAGGNATGGNAGLYAVAGSIAVDGNAYVSTQAFGGDATIGFGGNGGDALGGTSYLLADGSPTESASVTIGGNADVYASGYGGDGGAGDGSTIAAGNGGTGTGGTYQGAPGTGGAFALAGRDGGILSVAGTTFLQSSGYGGRGGAGGTGQMGGAGGSGIAGTTQAGTYRAFGDGSLGDGQAIFDALTLTASGFGGQGGTGGSGQGIGGIGRGGFAGVFAVDSWVDAARISTTASGFGGFGSTGGDGFGGNAGVAVTSGMMTAASLFASAGGSGGGATTGQGGTGTGGETSIDTDVDTNSILNVTGDIDYSAFGSGGSSELGNGGIGRGGTARLANARTGSLTVGGRIALSAGSSGGSGVVGGDAFAGNALFEVEENSTTDIGSLDLFANASGGSGTVTAGMAVAGDARLFVNGGAFTAQGNVDIFADAFGGTGLDGANGGAAYGGIASIQIDGGDATIGDGLIVFAGGFGGSAQGPGGDGGDGFGGAALVSVGGNANQLGSLTVDGTLSMLSDGYGGRGGDGDGTIAAGKGGLGQGGRDAVASLVDGEQGTGAYVFVSSDYGRLSIPGGANITALGQGGEGGNAPEGSTGGRGGDAIGGDVLVGLVGPMAGGPRLGSAVFGTLNVASRADAGSGGTDDTGRYTGVGGNAFGGNILVASRGSGLSAGSIGIFDTSVGGAGSTGGNATGGQAGMATSDGGTIDVGDYHAASVAYGGLGQSGPGGNAIGGIAFLGFQGGTTSISGSATVDASGYGGESIEGDGGDGTGGTADIAIFSASVGSGSVTGPVNISANGLGGSTQSTSGEGGTGTGGLAYVRSQAGGSISFGSVSLSANGTAGVDADGAPSGDAIGGLVQVLADGGGLFTADFLQIDASGTGTAGSFQIIANGGTIELDEVDASAVGAQAGDASLIRAAGGTIPISGSARFTLTGDFDIVTANGGLIGGPSLAAPSARIDISTEGTVTIDGDDDDRISFGGETLAIRSRELDILSGARIGAQLLQLNVVGNDHRTVIGGSGDTAGYTLTQDELGRIDAGATTFATSLDGSASDDLLFRDTTISGSLDEGVSELEISARVVRVEGMVTYRDAADTDYLGIFADRLEIVTPGGIQILGPNDRYTGTFEFEGGNFWMADADTIALLQGDVAFEGRNDLLATSAPGSDDPLGYLRAGDVEIDIWESFLVRNTGSAAEPGGITVTGSLTVDGDGDESEVPLDVFAYGRRQNEDGSFTTGADFFALVDFEGGEDEEGEINYSDDAQFNNCGINSGECTVVEEPDEREEVLEEVEEEAPAAAVTTTEPVASAPIEQSEQDSNVEFGADFPGLLSASFIAEQDTIDDPVASGGDIALYGSGDGGDDDAEEDGAAEEDTDAQ
ncbi:hypothetical protein [Erythrobacter sp. AP23]|uniref:beta strand repeat-containing protein n=1 Tax=Erythrobacter sp. AP23 TaxID=499656 RepID=UPI000A932C12|nr:hypothetical protein [Erythrobacter sp. AP23]